MFKHEGIFQRSYSALPGFRTNDIPFVANIGRAAMWQIMVLYSSPLVTKARMAEGKKGFFGFAPTATRAACGALFVVWINNGAAGFCESLGEGILKWYGVLCPRQERALCK